MVYRLDLTSHSFIIAGLNLLSWHIILFKYCQILAVAKFSTMTFNRENSENKTAANISRYTVWTNWKVLENVDMNAN